MPGKKPGAEFKQYKQARGVSGGLTERHRCCPPLAQNKPTIFVIKKAGDRPFCNAVKNLHGLNKFLPFCNIKFV
ncbi:hypothetical protein B4100_2388 [Heyndrickxia coagulans]|nr:hypothetical protein B4100_2388 [Heyndrickxia coagulans]